MSKHRLCSSAVLDQNVILSDLNHFERICKDSVVFTHRDCHPLLHHRAKLDFMSVIFFCIGFVRFAVNKLFGYFFIPRKVWPFYSPKVIFLKISLRCFLSFTNHFE